MTTRPRPRAAPRTRTSVPRTEGKDIQVKRDLKADLSLDRFLGVLKEVEEQGEGYQKLKGTEKAGKKHKDRDMGTYNAVWEDQAKAKDGVRNKGIGIKNHDDIQAETKGNGGKNYEKQNNFSQAEGNGKKNQDIGIKFL